MPERMILVIEDDPKTAASIRLYLEQAGFQVALAHDGREGLAEARRGGYDLLVLDLMLPEVDGMTICRALRSESRLPIIMLTARTTPADRVEGLETGADDYVPKPFSPRELVARVRAVLRRSDPRERNDPSCLRFEGLEIDLERREVRAGGLPVSLTRTEFDLLSVLAGAPGRVFSRSSLVERVLGSDYEGQERTVDAHVMNLRRKIDPDRLNPSFIHTVFGVGYKFEAAGRTRTGR